MYICSEHTTKKSELYAYSQSQEEIPFPCYLTQPRIYRHMCIQDSEPGTLTPVSEDALFKQKSI